MTSFDPERRKKDEGRQGMALCRLNAIQAALSINRRSPSINAQSSAKSNARNRDTTVDTITTNPYVRVFGLCVFVCEDSNSVYGADDKQDRDLEYYEELKEK